MHSASSIDAGAVPRQLLPTWWRSVLIAVAIIILCSCSAPAAEPHWSSGPAASEQAPPATDVPGIQQPTELTATDLTAESTIACPTCPPGAACYCCPNSNDPNYPMVGPSDEYLCDGGDYGTPAGVRADWVVEGLEEEDAVGHYDTLDGRVIVTPSNRVCIYAPRFAAVRRVVNLIAHEQPQFINEMREDLVPVRAVDALPPTLARQRHGLIVNRGERPASLYRQRQQAGGLENLQAAMDAYTSLAPYANLEIIRTGEISDAEKPLLEKSIESAIALTGNQAPQVAFGIKMAQAMVGVRQPGVIYQTDEPNRPRMRLLKLASCGHALPGEEIEFTLRFDNVGDQVIGNVTIVDNLSRRFEYVVGSAKSSVDARFLTEPNDGESAILRWEIKDPVEPGQGGILRFRVKVR